MTINPDLLKERYYHFLWEDDNGAWKFVGKCAEYTTGWSPTYNPTAGGMFARHNSTIVMPPETKTIPEGTKIMVSDDDAGIEVRVTGNVVKYDRNVMQNRLWI
jgi:3D (Asp-Asp-Asp) domain-containing protein